MRDRANHPRAHPVAGPLGVFPSASLAADAAGVSSARMRYWCSKSKFGWRYIPKCKLQERGKGGKTPDPGTHTARAVRQAAGAPLQIVRRSDTAKGFVVLPKRWIVERTFAWLNRCRRLAKDVEHRFRSHFAFVLIAMIRIMTRRIARHSVR